MEGRTKITYWIGARQKEDISGVFNYMKKQLERKKGHERKKDAY